MIRAMCGVHQKDKERTMNLMLMLGLIEPTDHMTMANSVQSCVEEEDSHILRKSLMLRLLLLLRYHKHLSRTLRRARAVCARWMS